MKLHEYNFKAVIFDMDGVLIDSEPLWKIAMWEEFQKYGSTLSKSDFQRTVGLRIDQVVHYWNTQEQWQIQKEAEVVQAIISRMMQLIRENPEPLPGVIETLNYLQGRGIPMALATSSPEKLMRRVLEALRLMSCFESVHSAELLPYGKPHPEVYLNAASALKTVPTDCLVIEDSLNGVISAKAARMTVVCIPEKTHQPNPKLAVADYHCDSLHDLLEELMAWN